MYEGNFKWKRSNLKSEINIPRIPFHGFNTYTWNSIIFIAQQKPSNNYAPFWLVINLQHSFDLLFVTGFTVWYIKSRCVTVIFTIWENYLYMRTQLKCVWPKEKKPPKTAKKVTCSCFYKFKNWQIIKSKKYSISIKAILLGIKILKYWISIYL